MPQAQRLQISGTENCSPFFGIAIGAEFFNLTHLQGKIISCTPIPTAKFLLQSTYKPASVTSKFRWSLAFLVLCPLSGCGSLDTLLQRSGLIPNTTAAGNALNPIYRHLQVTVNGAVTYVTLGDIDKTPSGPVEVYYGAGQAVIRMQDGRIVGVTGLRTEWHGVTIRGAPTWTAAAQAATPHTLQRTRDVMPGYQHGISDTLLLRRISARRKPPLLEIPTEKLVWFEEQQAQPGVSGSMINAAPGSQGSVKLPPARYAVLFENNQEAVLYGEQCLAADYCLTWHRFMPKKP